MLTRKDQSGMSMISVVIGLAITGIIILTMVQLFSNSKTSLSRNQILNDLAQARKSISLANCNRTFQKALDAGINCGSTATTVIKAINASDQTLPGSYTDKNYGKFDLIQTRVSCRKNVITFEYARVDKNGFPIKDAVLGLDGKWQDIFADTYKGFIPFRTFPCT